ncbi:MAG: hypothetical protein ACRELA_03825 [Candidatus Rokuibacteriota bacterium]
MPGTVEHGQGAAGPGAAGGRGTTRARVALALFPVLLLVSCSRLPAWLDLASPGLTVVVVDRGEIQVTVEPSVFGAASSAAAPDVRYATTPLGEATWAAATAVSGPWIDAAGDGSGRVRATVEGLPPRLHHVGARVDRARSARFSNFVSILPLREAILGGNVAEGFFGHTVAMAGDVDGDGHGDLLVGAPWSDEGLESARPRYARWLRRGLRALGFPIHGGKAGAA